MTVNHEDRVNTESAGQNVILKSGSKVPHTHYKMKWVLLNSSSSLVAGSLNFLLHRKPLQSEMK